MKRDMDLIRKILFYIEDNYKAGTDYVNIEMDGISGEEIYEHSLLAYQSGLINNLFEKSFISGTRVFKVGNLTNAGFDYLDSIRDDGTWQKTIKTITDKGLSMSVGTITTIAKAFITASAEGVANSILKSGGV